MADNPTSKSIPTPSADVKHTVVNECNGVHSSGNVPTPLPPSTDLIPSNVPKPAHGSYRVMPSHVAIKLSATSVKWPSHPLRVICPECFETVVTTTQHTIGRTALCASGLLLLTGIILLPLIVLACIPLILPTFKNTEHFCPNCKYRIGVKYK